jgi:purine-nucleoside phosphorylase
MTRHYQQAAEAAEFLRARCRALPTVAVVLGSGLGEFAKRPTAHLSLDYREIPHFPGSTVPGHEGRLILGECAGRSIAVLSGRVHLYEGHDARTVTFAVRTLGLLGVRTLILTNASGAVNTAFSVGDPMVLDDHINLLGANPLIGDNDERFGPRFPDMSEVYSRRLRALADHVAGAAGIKVCHGVYAAVPGPNYETPAEIRCLRAIGADAVGMSTVPEAIAARHMGLEVLGLSCLTNMAAGVLPQPLSHQEVMETAGRSNLKFATLLEGIVARL